MTNCLSKNSTNIENKHKIKFDYYSPKGIENIEIFLKCIYG